MSTLVLVLTAAMAVPGNGPETVSAEMEQGLDLRGEWEGTWQDDRGKVWQAKLNDLKLTGCSGKSELQVNHFCPLVACESEGHFTIKWSYGFRHGIYERRGEWVIICFCEWEREPPTVLEGGRGQHLLILRRVKPRK